MKMRETFNRNGNLESELRGKYHQLFNQLAGLKPGTYEYHNTTSQLHTVNYKLQALRR